MKKLVFIILLLILASAAWPVRLNEFMYFTPTPAKPSEKPAVADTLDKDPTIGYIKGQVVDIDGFGLQFANITCRQEGKWITGAQTDKNGRFTIRIPEGNYLVRASLVGHAQIDSLQVKVMASNTTKIPTLTMHRVGTGDEFRETVIIQVQDSKGNPIEGVAVMIEVNGEKKLRGMTTDAGLYRLRRGYGDSSGYTNIIHLSAEGYQPKRVEIKFKEGQKLRREITLKANRRSN
jgi:hypothetical protein